MNWLIKRLADEKTYFPLFLSSLLIYGLLACLVVSWSLDHCPQWVGRITLLSLIGSMGIGFGARVAHNLAYAKVHSSDNQ
jgi:hypothetical protein